MLRAVWLDGLRGIAAAIVATDHYFMGAVLDAGFRSFWAEPPEANRRLIQLPPFRLLFAAHAMVPLFFVISGYAISINLIQLRDGNRGEFLRRLSSAATRRGLRIYLPVLVTAIISQVLFFFGLFSWDFGDDVLWGRKPWIAPWFHVEFVFRYMLDNINILAIQYNGGLNGQLWTMALEYRGSCVVYLAMLTLGFWRPRLRLLALAVSMAYWFYFGLWDVFAFLAGLWLAELHAMPKMLGPDDQSWRLPAPSRLCGETWMKAHSFKHDAIPTYLCFALGIWLVCLSDDGELPPGYQFLQVAESSRWDGNWGIIDKTWKTIGSVLIVYAISRSGGLQRPLNSRPVQFLGRISFSLYLVHQAIYHLLSNPVRSALWFTVTGEWQPDADAGSHPVPFIFCWIGGYLILSAINVYVAILYTKHVDVPCINLAKRFDEWVSR